MAKKIVAIILSVFLLILLTGCGSSGSSSKPDNKQTASAPAPAPAPQKPAFTPILDKPTGYDPQFQQRNSNGLGELTIDNTRNSFPVYVKLYYLDSGKETAVRAFYIQKNDSFTANKISPGLYDVRYRNLQNGSLAKTDQFTLKQTSTSTGTQYSSIRFTLYTVSGGNTRMTAINESQFQ